MTATTSGVENKGSFFAAIFSFYSVMAILTRVEERRWQQIATVILE